MANLKTDSLLTWRAARLAIHWGKPWFMVLGCLRFVGSNFWMCCKSHLMLVILLASCQVWFCSEDTFKLCRFQWGLERSLHLVITTSNSCLLSASWPSAQLNGFHLIKSITSISHHILSPFYSNFDLQHLEPTSLSRKHTKLWFRWIMIT